MEFLGGRHIVHLVWSLYKKKYFAWIVGFHEVAEPAECRYGQQKEIKIHSPQWISVICVGSEKKINFNCRSDSYLSNRL